MRHQRGQDDDVATVAPNVDLEASLGVGVEACPVANLNAGMPVPEVKPALSPGLPRRIWKYPFRPANSLERIEVDYDNPGNTAGHDRDITRPLEPFSNLSLSRAPALELAPSDRRRLPVMAAIRTGNRKDTQIASP
jgi:hypothetical protein